MKSSSDQRHAQTDVLNPIARYFQKELKNYRNATDDGGKRFSTSTGREKEKLL